MTAEDRQGSGAAGGRASGLPSIEVADGAAGPPDGESPGEAAPGGETPFADPPAGDGRPGRLVDPGAIFAGWVGLGMALVIAIAFQLIVAIQPIVFLLAPFAGVLIGAYANHRSERRRPVGRVMSNAAYAGIVTGLGLAIMYVALRLLFVYADTGFRPGADGQLDCTPGPDCVYARYVAEGYEDDLAEIGVVDGPTFGEHAVREYLAGGVLIVALTLGGALVAGVFRALSRGGGESGVSGAPGEGTVPV